QPVERRAERLARRPSLSLVLAPPPQPVVLFREVGQLEVEAERAQHRRLPLERELADGRSQLGPRAGLAGGPRLARECPDPLLRGEQALAFLLDEDAPEDL